MSIPEPAALGIPGRRKFVASEHIVFLSSGSDLVDERDHFEEIVKVVNEQVHYQGLDEDRFLIRVVRWEQAAPHRADGDPNRRFREEAERADVTVVLLHNDIRPGTKDEIEAALAVPDVEIAVIWMEPDSRRRRVTRELLRYLDDKKNVVVWKMTDAPGTRATSLEMYRVVSGIVLGVMRRTASRQLASGGELFYEQRGF